MSENHTGLTRWHACMQRGGNPALVAELIADDAVLHSPVVHTPQIGKALVMAYLTAAAQVLGNGTFRYVREVVDGDQAVLEFITEIDGITINGVDIIRFDSDDKITDFKVMVRPLKAVNKVWETMAAQLAVTRS